ncbi:PHB depolymerase family esterase [Rhodobacter sp. Har01]|uniref:extracellular catalytic domain type 1 short-chain-length polyhydroxyalkanoate depolymerase n=1 Tax=Rhodobacter sp. Har01 TaxID=2883999 RepID=UPI001D06D78A|nr:PHB depolymerase family esterase [Rhodobacter sp. Har01]MCB6179753.1 PHB depolymerase family esterase [Rhodobacter sp. Har01]
MTDFDPRAWRTAMGRLPSAAPSFAADLVQRTLAQHGLASGATAEATTSSPLQDMMARLRPAAADVRAAVPDIPSGARWQDEQFNCEAGSRRYCTYVPTLARRRATGMIVMLHGCTQTPEDFAAGTGMNALAEAHGFIVVYPHQSRGENAQTCWNWFRRGDQHRDQGEPSILAGLARNVAAAQGVPGDRIFVAGLSAGAAMSVILGETYPDLFSGVGAHSGLPGGAATDLPSAFAAMAGNGPDRATRPGAVPVRTIVLHGSADTTVHPSNGRRIAERAVALGPRQVVQVDDRGTVAGRAFVRQASLDSDGTALVEHWDIEGLGHAWSGGSPRGSFTDARGPNASEAMIRFFFARDGLPGL